MSCGQRWHLSLALSLSLSRSLSLLSVHLHWVCGTTWPFPAVCPVCLPLCLAWAVQISETENVFINQILLDTDAVTQLNSTEFNSSVVPNSIQFNFYLPLPLSLCLSLSALSWQCFVAKFQLQLQLLSTSSRLKAVQAQIPFRAHSFHSHWLLELWWIGATSSVTWVHSFVCVLSVRVAPQKLYPQNSMSSASSQIVCPQQFQQNFSHKIY